MRKQAILLSCAVLSILAAGSYAEDKQPFLGVLLDEAPLPELLTKHLGLEPGQGLRVVNISVGSTAEKVGLDRDDILVAFQGQKVSDPNEFIAAMKKAGVGATVSLELIHLGQRKTVQFQLDPAGKMEWKYPSEPQIVTSWRPGKIFKIGPDGQQLVIPFDKFPDLSNFFKYTYQCTGNGENYTIAIEGNPASEDTKVIVRVGETEHSATVGQIDKLPEKYRDSAKQAVENARENIHITTSLRFPDSLQPDVYKNLFGNLPQLDVQRLAEEKDRTIEKLREEMKELRQRLREIEDKLSNKKDGAEPKSDKAGSSASSRHQEKPSV